MVGKVKRWVEQNKLEAVLLLAALLLATVLRLWRIDEYLPFLGDEGRDVRVVRRFLTDFDLMFIGPRTSIGDMYLGPLYYYLISPFLAIWQFSPVGPAVFVALLSVATVYLVWYVAREWFGKIAAASSALLFAISPLVIDRAKHSWNPNIMPFFALLVILSIWKVWKDRDFKWFVVLGVSFAFVLQSHYLGLLLAPTIALFWFSTLIKRRNGKWKIEHGKFLHYTLASIVIFAILMSPLFIFDTKHGWRNLGAMTKFFTERQTTLSAKPWNALPELWPLWNEHIVTQLVAAKNGQVGVWIAIAVLIGIAWLAQRYYKRKEIEKLRALILLCAWVLIGLVGLGVYKQHVYDHYFGFLFPAPFLLIGAVMQGMWDKKFRWLVMLLLLGLVLLNLKETPLKYPPQRQMQRVQNIDLQVEEEAGGQPFNFALIAKRNYEEGYLYFFELWNAPVREIDPQRLEGTLTDQLFVVCEDSPTEDNPEPCNPINHPKAEIANFGWAKIEKEWEVGGGKLFKLVHTQ